MQTFDGLKTYALGLALVLIGGLEMVHVDVVESVNPANAFEWLTTGLALITGRSALKKVEK